MKKLTTAILSVALAGCSIAPQAYREPPRITTTAPKCTGKIACEAMWIDAQQEIEMLTRMRVRMVTDNRIVTYAPANVSTMGGEVVKYPVGENVYELRVSFECYRHTDCSDLKVMATNLFNSRFSEK